MSIHQTPNLHHASRAANREHSKTKQAPHIHVKCLHAYSQFDACIIKLHKLLSSLSIDLSRIKSSSRRVALPMHAPWCTCNHHQLLASPKLPSNSINSQHLHFTSVCYHGQARMLFAPAVVRFLSCAASHLAPNARPILTFAQHQIVASMPNPYSLHSKHLT